MIAVGTVLWWLVVLASWSGAALLVVCLLTRPRRRVAVFLVAHSPLVCSGHVPQVEAITVDGHTIRATTCVHCHAVVGAVEAVRS